MKKAGLSMNCSGAEVFLQAISLGRPRNRRDPRLLREQPGQRDLRRRRLLSFSERLQPLDECQVGLAVLFGESRNDVAEVVRIERGLLVDLLASCQ